MSRIFDKLKSRLQLRDEHRHNITTLNVVTDTERCKRIMNYWLDAELFDLPECPMDREKGIASKEAESFIEDWGDSANQRCLTGELEFDDKSRLLIMFQCHLAGYLIDPGEEHPNYQVPRTFLVAQAMIPSWDQSTGTIRWTRSEEDQDVSINMATIRTLYRKCSSSVPKNMSLSQWVESRYETITNRLAHSLSPDDGKPALTTRELQQQIVKINRDLASEFWPDAASRDYMEQRCKPIDSQFAEDDTDRPHRHPSGAMTFRWRHCYYPEGNDNSQLGPFFVQDLEHIIQTLDLEGAEGLSAPLSAYLLGAKNQQELTPALDAAEQYFPLTNRLIRGRWPENPAYGLSLLQTVAVNVALQRKDNPVVAVNGPPGTGKTTLLKDVIAERFVSRTRDLDKAFDPDKAKSWLDASLCNAVLDHSMLVASSNNKAVENISKELPSLAKLAGDYQEHTHYFKSIAPKGDWGIFCAVLGNSSNRKDFKDTVKKLSQHLKGLGDHFQLRYFVNSLKKAEQGEAQPVIDRFVDRWHRSGQLQQVVEDIQATHAFKNAQYKDFLEALCQSLLKIDEGELTVDALAEAWCGYETEYWDAAIDALDRVRRQWFGMKMASQRRKDHYKNAKSAYEDALARWETFRRDITGSNAAEHCRKWELDQPQYSPFSFSYQANAGEDAKTAEARIQQQSPLGSKGVNHLRTELFIRSLVLNEAIIELGAEAITEQDWKDLQSLVDGRLETNEKVPYHQRTWALLFLFFPVVSSSLASAEAQFKLMQKPQGFGLVMFDESGQAVNYHVAGLLQRCKQAIFVGDPIQLEPVVTMPPNVDRNLADDFVLLGQQDGQKGWGDDYLVSASSAQSIADKSGNYFSRIGDRTVGIPLLVHRRCTEPMFGIANRIAYDNKMVLASMPYKWQAVQSGWVNITEPEGQTRGSSYYNGTEAEAALALTKHLCQTQPEMVEGGVYIITPFSKMRKTLQTTWNRMVKDPAQHDWMKAAMGRADDDLKAFAFENIGTVHTFQGKEASTVIICTAASSVRKNMGGVQWVNSKPNLINVAVTRAKHHLFVLGNQKDWESGVMSGELQVDGMKCYPSLEALFAEPALPVDSHQQTPRKKRLAAGGFALSSD